MPLVLSGYQISLAEASFNRASHKISHHREVVTFLGQNHIILELERTTWVIQTLHNEVRAYKASMSGVRTLISLSTDLANSSTAGFGVRKNHCGI